MQVSVEQIKRQQEILAVLGFYFGRVDGIWGPKTIEAKKKFEASPAFTPGIPNNGMPFGDRPPYPSSISLDHTTNLLYHPKLDEKAKVVEVEPEPESYNVPPVSQFEVAPPVTQNTQSHTQQHQHKKK